MENKLCYTVAEVAKLIGVSKPMAYDMVHIQGFPHIRVGTRIRIPKNAFHLWFDEYSKQGGQIKRSPKDA